MSDHQSTSRANAENDLYSSDMEKFFKKMQENHHPFADLTDSFVFKDIVFSKEENEDILLYFLNTFLEHNELLKGNPVLGRKPLELLLPLEKVTFLPPLNPLPWGVKDDFQTSVDLRYMDLMGNRVIYGIDNYPYSCEGYLERTKLDAYIDFAQNAWTNGGNTVFVSILNSDTISLEDDASYISCDCPINSLTDEIILFRIYRLTIELKKFQKTKDEIKKSNRDLLVYLIKNSSKMTPEEVEEVIGDEPVLWKLFQLLVVPNWTSEDQEVYYLSQQTRVDYKKFIIRMEEEEEGEEEEQDNRRGKEKYKDISQSMDFD
jgi:hypothetical protein